MRTKALLALLLFIGLVSGQSYICSRTAVSDTYCNEDGTRSAVFYSYQSNVLTEAGWQPFEDVAVLEYVDDHFELTYGNQTARIDLFAVVDSKETATKDTDLKIEPIIIKQRGGFEYGVRLDNADKIEAFGFRIAGDGIKEVRYDFSDTVTDKTSLEMVDAKTALVRNTAKAEQLTIDPTITLTEANNGNVADSFVDEDATSTNYGTEITLKVSQNTGDANRTFVMWDMRTIPVGATITNANFSLRIASPPAASRTYEAYNTSADWNETGITWANQPADDTLQDSVATGTTDDVWLTWNVTNASIVAHTQQINMSLLVKDSVETGLTTINTTSFYARDSATVAKRPKLVITYTSAESYPEDNLIGYWRFNEGAGNSTDDSSGSGNIGWITGANWTTSKYRMNYTLTYDGTNDQVDVGNSSTLDFGTGDFTVCAWVKPFSYQMDAAGDYAVGEYNASGSTFWVLGYRYNYTGFVVQNSSGSNTPVSGSLIVPDAWIYLCGRRLGDIFTLWENGVVVNTTTAAKGSLTSPASVCIGSRCGGNYFNGTVDEVKIFDTWKSAAYILAEYLKNGCLYEMNITCFNESSTSQQIYYDLIISNSSSSETFSDMWNWTSNNYCNGSTPVNDVTVSISNESFYSPRYYYEDTDSDTNLTAYLLPLSDLWEQDVTILVNNEVGGVVSNALVTVSKTVGGSYAIVAQDKSDGAGQTYFNLDKQTSYLLVANKSGYIQSSLAFQPSKDTYTITLIGTSTNTTLFNDSLSGISWNVTPAGYMVTGIKNFNFSIYCSNDDLEFWGMNVTYNGSLQYTTNQTDSGGGSANYTMNTSNVLGNGINVSIFFKRVGGPYFDPTYQYWGYTITASNYSLVDSLARVGTSDLSPLTKGMVVLVLIVCVVGYVGSMSFSGGVVLGLIMLWGFASVLVFMPYITLVVVTMVGLAIVYNSHFR